MNRKQLKQQTRDRIDNDLMDATQSVEINRDRAGYWQITCYDSHGYYIGGCSGMVDLDAARKLAHLYIRVF